jgi:hypothetical protein
MNEPESASPSLLAIHAHLVEEGFRPSFNDEGEIAFKFQGRHFYISQDESDPEFYRILCPGIWKIESEEERAVVFIAASDTCKGMKVAKVFVVDDEAWASVELFCPEVGAFLKLFERSTSLLYETGNVFRRNYHTVIHEETCDHDHSETEDDHETDEGDETPGAPDGEEPHH